MQMLELLQINQPLSNNLGEIAVKNGNEVYHMQVVIVAGQLLSC